jgi:DNA-binding XRE family transcriptional regulator
MKQNQTDVDLGMEELLGELYTDTYTDEARRDAVFRHLLNGEKIPRQYVDDVIESLMRLGDFHLAGTVARTAGLTRQAIALYEKTNDREDLITAYHLAREAGNTKWVQTLSNKIMASFEIDKDYSSAAHFAESVGLPERARVYRTIAKLQGWR